MPVNLTSDMNATCANDASCRRAVTGDTSVTARRTATINSHCFAPGTGLVSVGWAFWTGTCVFVVTIVGLLVLRRTDAARRVYRRTRRVLTVLLDARSALTGRDLRRRVGASRDSFYALVDDLVDRGLVAVDVVEVTVSSVIDLPGYRRYRLTTSGVAEARRCRRESSDQR